MPEPDTRLEPSLVRIRKGGKIVGAGFLVKDQLVCTCAHVIAQAVFGNEAARDDPGEEVEVGIDFPFLDGEAIEGRFKIVAWGSRNPQSDDDLAVLQLPCDAPSRAKPVRLVHYPEQTTQGRAVDVYGYPEAQTVDAEEEYDVGVWSGGTLGHKRANGTVQIEGSAECAYRVQPGFSGTPVWDPMWRGVAGMVVSAESDPATRVFMMIPAERIPATRPEISLIDVRYPSSDDGLTLAHELRRESFKLGEPAAANFPYQITPVQAAYDAASAGLRAASSKATCSKEPSGILILGYANTGKTRLAVETLIGTLPDWPVLRWNPAFNDERVNRIDRILPSLSGSDLALLVDDLQDYIPHSSYATNRPNQPGALVGSQVGELKYLVEKVCESCNRVVIVVTCRKEEELDVRGGLGWLFSKLQRQTVELPLFAADLHAAEVAPILQEFKRAGAIHEDDWDGTLGSLVLGLSTKNEQYLNMRASEGGTILRAMKLLTLAGISEHTERRLRVVCEHVFEQPVTHWREAEEELAELQFVMVGVATGTEDTILTIRKNAYLDRVVTDYLVADRPDDVLERDLILLGDALAELKDAEGLNALGVTLGTRAFGRQDGLVLLKRTLDIFELVLALNSHDAKALINKGITLANLDRYPEALEALNQALKLDPDNAKALTGKGITLSNLGRHKDALDPFHRALKLNPEDTDTLTGEGIALSALGRHEDALAVFEQASKLDPDDPDAWSGKGNALSNLNRPEEALEAFDRALALNPSTAEIWNAKGYALKRMECYPEALECIQRAIELAPSDGNYWDSLGEMYRAMGRYEDALDAFDRGLSLSPDMTNSWRNKAAIFRLLKRNAEAEDADRQVLGVEQN